MLSFFVVAIYSYYNVARCSVVFYESWADFAALLYTFLLL